MRGLWMLGWVRGKGVPFEGLQRGLGLGSRASCGSRRGVHGLHPVGSRIPGRVGSAVAPVGREKLLPRTTSGLGSNLQLTPNRCSPSGEHRFAAIPAAKHTHTKEMKIETVTVNTNTLAGLRKAERLHAAGWVQVRVTLFSVTFSRRAAK